MYFAFGRHRGQHISEVPSDYLAWCLRDCDRLNAWERSQIETELHRRRQPPRRETYIPPGALALADVEARVTTWFRRLCLQHHPDRGGSDKAMGVLNDAHDQLRQALGLANHGAGRT